MTQSGWNANYNSAKGSLLVGDGTRPEVRTVGTDGQVLTANSAQADGVEWTTLGTLSMSMQVFTASGIYVPTLGMKACIVEMVGGGAAGGGAEATAAGENSVGGGGGSGEYARSTFSAATIGASQTVTIGAAGTGASGVAGGNGSTTSLGALMTALGGSGGSTGTAGATSSAAGGTGGTGGTGGDFVMQGSSGKPAFSNTLFGASGAGGGSFFGNGGIAAYYALASQAGVAPAGTNNYGSGGSGGINDASQSAVAGGNGSDGVVVITEFV